MKVICGERGSRLAAWHCLLPFPQQLHLIRTWLVGPYVAIIGTQAFKYLTYLFN